MFYLLFVMGAVAYGGSVNLLAVNRLCVSHRLVFPTSPGFETQNRGCEDVMPLLPCVRYLHAVS